jgi:hypothetical protein
MMNTTQGRERCIGWGIMAKGKSWGQTQEMYVNSDLCKERCRNATLVGVLHRVAGLLGVEGTVDAVSDWCLEKERVRREELEKKGGGK